MPLKKEYLNRFLADGALLIITAIWGATFIMVDAAIETVNVLIFLSYRFSIAFCILLLIFNYRLVKYKVMWKEFAKGTIIGVFLFAGYFFQTFGLDQGTDPGKAAFITGLSVVLVPIFATFFLKKVPRFLSWMGIAVAVVGLGLLSFGKNITFQFNEIFGDILVFICAICFALHIIFIDKFVATVHYSTLAVVQTGITAALAWISALVFTQFPTTFAVEVFPLYFTKQAIFALLFTGIIATALILVAQTYAQKKTPPIHVAIIFALEPVFGAVFALIFTNETFLIRQWIGCALILVSMFFQQIIDIKISPKKIQQEQE